MKLRKYDKATGFMDLQVDHLDDLWTLGNLLQVGDLVVMDTYRTKEEATDKLRAEKAPKVRMRLGLRVTDVQWHDFDDHLRIHGTIETGPQDLGRHHTHIVRDDPGTRLQVHKPNGLQGWHLQIAKDAESDAKEARVLLLALDDDEAQFAWLRGYGLQYDARIVARGQGKRFAGAEAAKGKYYQEILVTLQQLATDTEVMVVGPGWWREEFLQFCKEKGFSLAMQSEGTSQGGRTGIQEALKRGLVDRVAQNHRIAKETRLLEQFLTSLSKSDGLCAYGPDEVAAAVDAGAAEVVLVTDELVRSGKRDRLLRSAQQQRSAIHILPTAHDAGEQLRRLGGEAALLRFRLG